MTLNPAFRMLAARALTARATRRARKGFTLIELLVVVVIIGILAAIALPNFMGAQDKAKNASTISNGNSIRLALEQYSTDNGGFYPNNTSWQITRAGRQYFPGTTATASANNYLPNNTLPISPWGKTPQTVNIQASGVGGTTDPFLYASYAAGGSAMPNLQNLVNASGTAPQGAAPTNSQGFGSVEYDYDLQSQTYTLFAVGKRNKAAVTVFGTSNNGANSK